MLNHQTQGLLVLVHARVKRTRNHQQQGLARYTSLTQQKKFFSCVGHYEYYNNFNV